MLVLFSAALLTAAVTTSASSTRHLPQSIDTEWTKLGPASSETTVNLQIALSQDPNGIALLEKRALDSATPGSAVYRQHLSVDEIRGLVTPASSQGVLSWIRDNGLNAVQSHDWIDVPAAPVRILEDLLHTTFFEFQHAHTGERTVRSEHYSIPPHLEDAIDLIAPTTFLPAPSKPARRDARRGLNSRSVQTQAKAPFNRTLPACGDGQIVTLDCIRETYGFMNYSASHNTTSIGVWGYNYNKTDLQTFFTQYNKAAAKAHAVPKVIGEHLYPDDINSTIVDLETPLDISYTLGLVYPMPVVLYRNPENESLADGVPTSQDHYLDFLRQLATNKTGIPSVVSTSFGRNEGNVPEAYLRRSCQLVMQIGLRGTSMLFASGDDGSGGAAANHYHTGVFDVGFPGSCPYMTSVGATTHPLHEIAATEPAARFASGGGFSQIYPRPKWQDAHVKPYLGKINPQFRNISSFNPNGRGMPDIAAIGDHAPLTLNGETIPDLASGTSLATPVVASIIALLNDAEIRAGRPTLGFLNPWLYGAVAAGKGLRDISEGSPSTPIGGVPDAPDGLNTGYNVTVGWDAVTGLGVPDFQKLLKLAAQCKV
ncbi:hypothetical protein FH972_021804 [Carpinus fangiana]|uniref:Peptidase S53 domain-containing protein n=1 Tax=Carpinus fangiana TaxID=176857 RepID=A0A5N6KQR3_9ROSI|nr:hypothetical protein FH972_021804 [Carpinus fangiana]